MVERGTTVVEIENGRFEYDGRTVLDGITLSVNRGEVVALAGPNGAGKTTLLKLLSGVLRPKAGRVAVEGRAPATMPPRELARRLAVVPQETVFPFPYRVRDVVRMGRTPYLGFWGFESPDDLEATEEALALCDMADLADRYVTQISGGECQRAIIARALAQQPAILLLDEPTHSLDPRHTLDVFAILRRSQKSSGRTVVIVSHDLNALAGIADRIVLMRAGRIVTEGPPNSVLSPEHVRAAFGVEVEVLSACDGRPVVVPRHEPEP